MYCKEKKRKINEEVWFREELGRAQKMSVNEKKKVRLVHNATMCNFLSQIE